MVATTQDGNRGVPIGSLVYTADGQRLGYVVDGDAYRLDVGDGFLFRRAYALKRSHVQRYEERRLTLTLTMQQVQGMRTKQ